MITRSRKFRLITGMSIVASAMLILAMLIGSILSGRGTYEGSSNINYINGESYFGSVSEVADGYANEYILARHAPLGASHYAYTEGVSDEFVGDAPKGQESIFNPGSALTKITVQEDGTKTETELLKSEDGVIRDPSVSADGKRVLFSWKQNRNDDDFHLYEMEIETGEYKQLTFGQGVADIEPQYLPNGRIVFSSTRAVQKVDCWKTPVSNLFTCDADGKNIIRHGYDQVHTTYPTVTADGRVIYTRWDYNDRTQMFVQGVFQMFQDGTNQTELYGNGINAPTTLMHTRDIMGSSTKYVSIWSGHHTWQAGKLVIVDTAKGRNTLDAVSFVKESCPTDTNVDTAGQDGVIYSYPYAISSEEILVSRAEKWAGDRAATKFSIVYMNTRTGAEEIIVDGTEGSYSASQIVPIQPNTNFNRPSTVNYAQSTGTYYIGDVYEGEGLEGIERGTAKYLRVVALEYRSSAIGSNWNQGAGNNNTADPHSPVSVSNGTWDIKKVIGIVPIEEDGSVLVSVPADLPIYFQVLDEDGELIQSMRSWSTLMPGETFSCVGCHENKNSVPPHGATVTMAMKKGVQKLQKDLWMTGEEYENYDPYTDYKGFSYTNEVQTILDKSCTSCHNNSEVAYEKIGGSGGATPGTEIFPLESDWKYTTSAQSGTAWTGENFDDSAWTTGKAAFGNSPDGPRNTDLEFSQIRLRKSFTAPSAVVGKKLILTWQYDENPIVYLNGVKVAEKSGYITGRQSLTISNNLKAGKNTIAILTRNADGGCYIDASLSFKDAAADTTPVSLERTSVEGPRERMNYTLSYLVLTGAVMRGDFYFGDAENEYTNWISAMSQVEVLDPYQYGSKKSNVVQRLKANHSNLLTEGKLTEAEIQTIAAWIDLGVPFRGTYDEANIWNSNEIREFEELANMRNVYDKRDRLAKNTIAGIIDKTPFAIEYTDSLGGTRDEYYSEGYGLVQLFIGEKYEVGGKISITLPSGYDYIYVSLNHRIKDTLVYCPDGIFEYVIPSYAEQVMPGSFMRYCDPTISAYLPTEAELEQLYNVALNPYTDGISNVYPKTTSNDNFENQPGDASFMDRNATDGFTANKGHGGYPNQSWGPTNSLHNANNEASYLQVDFGREVNISYLNVFIRADFPHDTYFKSLTLEFSDGTELQITLQGVATGQKIEIPNGKLTSSIRLKDFVAATPGGWAAISELEVYGTNVF